MLGGDDDKRRIAQLLGLQLRRELTDRLVDVGNGRGDEQIRGERHIGIATA